MKSILNKWNRSIILLDKFSLGWVGMVLVILTFIPYMILKEGSVFVIHDQLDETILSYVLNARYLGVDTDRFPEVLNGINRTGMQPSAVLFVPLYRIFQPFTAFMIQYAIVILSSFWGMYFLIKRVTGSSIIALAIASCFCSLPAPPVYGLSVLGVPLLVDAFLCFCDKKRLILGYILVLFWGVTTHLVLIGYVVLGLWGCYIIYTLFAKKWNQYIVYGFVLLLLIYVITHYSLFIELIFGNSSYISHREQLVNGGLDFWLSVKQMWLSGGQHAVSLHSKLIIPICLMLLIESAFWGKMTVKERKSYWIAVMLLAGLFGIAVLYGFLKSDIVANWKNSMHGFLRYFQFERFYWLYPTGWYLEFAIVCSIWWRELKQEDIKGKDIESKQKAYYYLFRLSQLPSIKLLVLIVVLIPTLLLIKVNCNFYMNINQINNGSEITGYISWESYYAEDLMEQLEETIGKEMSTYRIAHLGISPAPSLMHGFYTVDGYSNNYPLAYKQAFRQVIEKELDKNEEVKVYFDTWGSRCYLFNSQTGNYYMLSKRSDITYKNLEFDMEALRKLGCEYLFSGGEIIDAEDMGLEFLGYFDTEKSYWGIWLYYLVDEM